MFLFRNFNIYNQKPEEKFCKPPQFVTNSFFLQPVVLRFSMSYHTTYKTDFDQTFVSSETLES